MLIAKVPAAVTAVLFMSSVSAQAMEFADRPGSLSETFASALAVRVMQSEERSHREINNRNRLLPVSGAWMKLPDRPMPISHLKRVWVVQMAFQNRPGRLSAEFSAVARGYGMNFEYGPGDVSGWLKPTGTRIAMKLPHHPGRIGTLTTSIDAGNIQLADRTFTSSIAKPIIRPGMRSQQSSAVTCVGSMAPCGSLSFVQPSRMGSLSAVYHDERL